MWLLTIVVGAFAVSGCGYSEDEWQQAQRDISKLKADLDAANKRHNDDENKYAQGQQTIQDLQAKLKDLGIGLSKSEEEKAKLKTAMAEYEARLKQLDDIKSRFRDLKSRLDKLTGAGLNVTVRHNKMVIQLPGDVLFDSGKDTLKGEGRRILKQVADIIGKDSTLSQRDFQIAGHTDKEPYGGQFIDNWGLSLMLARTELEIHISPERGDVRGFPSGGALQPSHFSAVGYGAIDPASGTIETQTVAEEQKNRRVELVLQPDVTEMLYRKELTGGWSSPTSLRVAAIDIGTNTVLLLVAERDAEGRIRPVVERATITRLGAGVDRTRRLDTEAGEADARLLGLLRHPAARSRGGARRRRRHERDAGRRRGRRDPGGHTGLARRRAPRDLGRRGGKARLSGAPSRG